MSKLLHRRSLVLQTIILLLVVGSIITATQYRVYVKDRELQSVAVNRNLTLMQLMTDSYLGELERDAEFIANSPVLKMYLRSMSPSGLAPARSALYTLSMLRPEYDQIRYIDRYGIEQIRVNRREGQSQLALEGLQLKSDRDYVQAGLALEVGGVYLSSFDLNVENGRIEIPYRPMVRAVARVDVDGVKAGMIVLNGKVEMLTRRLQTVLPASAELVMFNDQGGWIAGGDLLNWQFAEDPAASFAAQNPVLWKTIEGTRTGQFEYQGECYHYRWHRYSELHVQSPTWLIAQRMVGQNCSAVVTETLQGGGIRFVLAILLTFPLLFLWYKASERKRELQEGLEAKNEELRLITEEAGHGLLMVDQNCLVQWINPEAERLLGWKESELVGRNLHETCHTTPKGESLHPGPCPTLQALKTGQRYRSDHERLMDRFGNLLQLNMSVSAYGTEHNRRAIVSISDVSKHIEIEQTLTTLAATDSLTGVMNRRSVLHTLESWLHDVNNPPCVLMLDIDYFKQVNDTHGHNAGDKVLKQFTRTISELLRKEDALGRLGGEEFLVAIHYATLENAAALAERICQKVSESQCLADDGSVITVTTSIGVAVFNGHETLEQLLARADHSLYRAKHGGRNQVHLA